MEHFNLGELHPALIHFPIVLIWLVFICDIIASFYKRECFQKLANWLIIIAAIILIPVAFTGFIAKESYPSNDPDVLRHQNMATVMIFYTIAYAIFRFYVLMTQKLFSIYLFLFLSLINVGLVNMTAEFGGIVVRGKGITSSSLRPPGTPLPYDRVKS